MIVSDESVAQCEMVHTKVGTRTLMPARASQAMDAKACASARQMAQRPDTSWKMYLDVAHQTDRHVEQPVTSHLEIRLPQPNPDAQVQSVQRQETDSFPPGPVG